MTTPPKPRTRKLKVPGERKFYLDFASALVNFAPEQKPQFLFTIEVTLRYGHVGDLQLDDALESIRELGAAEIVNCEMLGGKDKRRL